MGDPTEFGQRYTSLSKTDEYASEKEIQLSSVLETIGEGIVIVDSVGKIVLVSREIDKLFGHSGAELLGKNVTNLMPPKFRQAHEAGMERY